MSPSRNWDSPTLSLASECTPPTGTKGGGHTRLRVRGWGSPNSDDLRKCLELCLLCALEGLAANAKVAAVLGAIPASSDTVEYEGWQMKQCLIKCKQKGQKIPLLSFS